MEGVRTALTYEQSVRSSDFTCPRKQSLRDLSARSMLSSAAWTRKQSLTVISGWLSSSQQMGLSSWMMRNIGYNQPRKSQGHHSKVAKGKWGKRITLQCDLAGRCKCSQCDFQYYKMKEQISILLVAVILSLVNRSNNYCLSASQIDGLCTACNPPQLLISGYCVTPMSGCISQLANNFCTQCSAGYYLRRWSCVPIGVAASNLMSIMQVYADTSPDCRYEYLNIYFKRKYSQYLSSRISDLTQLITVTTTYGSIYTITYYNPYSNVTQYRAEALVDSNYNITQYSFGAVNNSTMLWFLNRKAVVSNLQSLQPAVLNKVQQFSSNDYRLFYLDFTGRIQVMDVQRTPNLTSVYRTFPTLTQLYYEINQDTVINYVFSVFPNLQLYENYTASYYSIEDSLGNFVDYFKFIFDNQVVVIISVTGLDFSLYSYQEPDSVSSNPAATLNLPPGYLPLLTLTDPSYLNSYAYLLLRYPFLAYKNVEGVRYQLVAGTNFMITLNSQPFTDDVYVALIYQPLNLGLPVISSLYKNGVDMANILFSTPAGSYNYQADPNFKALYTYFQMAMVSTLGNLLPIYQVLFVANPNRTNTYQVIYSTAESALLQYSPNSPNPYTIISYSAMGLPIPINANISSQSGTDVSRNSIIQFLKQQNPQLFSSLLITSSVQTSPGIYNLDILTSFGSYFARVVNRAVLYLSAISFTSSNLCSDLSRSEFTSNSVVSALNTYLTANYAILNGYTLQAVQGYMNNWIVNYRFLYSLNQNRYEFQMVYSTQLGKYLTNKVTPFSGSGCSVNAVLLGGSCLADCLSFSF